MRIYPVIVTMLLLPFGVLAQTNISGVINSYHKVTEVFPATSCLRLDNTSGLTPGDLVLIIQMKGATVNTANNNSFGSITSLNNAGNYELATICSVQDDMVCLLRQLVQSYTPSDKVQLVKIPQYSSATVIDTLKAVPWDSATGKGGVLTLSVSTNLVLNAPMSATGKGYKGGTYLTSSSSCSNFFPTPNYFYDASLLNPQFGAYKGEGIASLGVGFSGGKGAAANGGGGGNNHNNGGAGGSNLVAGGNGGGNSSSTGCSVSNPGIGGYALSSNSGNKIYMGGGGGAGHANSGFFSTGGGTGGGIVVVLAGNLISNGHKIMANGSDGGSTVGDGASGGGAAGTILLSVTSYADALNAEAKGGNGGNENDDFIAQRCYGEGGGGSGGAIYFKTTVPAGTISVAGGTKGSRLNSVSCAAIVSGANGTNGNTVPNYNLIQSTVPSTFCSVSLDVQLLKFNVKPSGSKATIEWQVDHIDEMEEFVLERKKDGSNWNNIYSIRPSTQVLLYNYVDGNLENGSYHYRLKLTEKTGRVTYSVIKSIHIGNTRISLYPNPASGNITISYPFKAGTKMKVLNALGETLLQKEFHRSESFIKQDISSFSRGVYYIIIDHYSISFSIQ